MVNDRKTGKTWKFVLKLFISIIFLCIQIAFYFFLFFGINSLKGPYPIVYKSIYAVVEIIGIISILLMYRRLMNPAYKLSWTIFILLCPFLGTMCFLFFGNGRVLPKRRQIKFEKYIGAYPLSAKNIDSDNLDEDFVLISRALYNDSKFPLYKNCNLKFFTDILDKHNDMIEKLYQAKKFIFMEYFIFGKGKIMEELIDVLENKGNQGVEIKIIYDDIGSLLSRDKRVMKRLRAIPNLSIQVYEPIGLKINPRVNYRDHRKICIIDGNIAYTGGDNIADEYIHYKTRFGFWRDNAIRIEGNAVESFTNMFISMWYMSSRQKLDIEKYLPAIHIENDNYVLPFSDGPMNRDNPAYHLFLNLINSAKKSIYISTPYFIIDSEMINAIINKRNQGVDIKILIPNVPDKKIVYLMTYAHIEILVKNNVEVYRYTPGFNHAKNIIIDDKMAFIGTINMDYRALLLHFEDGCLIYNTSEIDSMSKDFLEAVSDSKLIDLESVKNRNIFIRLIEFLLQIVSPLL